MKKRVKILRTPGGKKTVGDQMGYGLYRAQGVRDFESFDKEAPEENIKTTYPESPREEANIEVEKGEKIIARDGLSVQDVGGKKHSKGGTPVKAEPGSYVVSDFINAPKEMQKAMGFDAISSNKKKDNTWARVLESKVKSKDYNRLSQILQDAQSGKDVDPYELKTAQIKFPNYQDYVSKAALGGELTKAMMGKPYDIPQIAMPALQKLMGGQQQQGGGNQLPEQPQMGFGGLYKYKTGGEEPCPGNQIRNEQGTCVCGPGFTTDEMTGECFPIGAGNQNNQTTNNYNSQMPPNYGNYGQSKPIGFGFNIDDGSNNGKSFDIGAGYKGMLENGKLANSSYNLSLAFPRLFGRDKGIAITGDYGAGNLNIGANTQFPFLKGTLGIRGGYSQDFNNNDDEDKGIMYSSPSNNKGNVDVGLDWRGRIGKTNVKISGNYGNPRMEDGGLHEYQTDGTVKPKSTVFHTPTGDIEAPIYPQVPPGYTPYPEIDNLWQLPGQAGTPGNAPSVNQAIGGGKPNSQWEKWLISQLQKGVTIEELAAKKHGTIQGLQKYKQYYKPIAGTEATETKYATTYKPITVGGGGSEKQGGGDKFACIDGYVQQVNPATANQPGVIYYNSQAEAEAVCKKGGGGEGNNDGGNPFYRLPYQEDINNLANAVHTRYAYHNVPPWQAKAQPAYINPVLGSTEGVDRLIQSQGRTAMEDASLYGGSPQAQAARVAQINSSTLPSMVQNRVGTNLQNIQSQYAADQYNNQIYNQFAMQDAAAATDLSDKNAKYTYNVDKSKVMGDTNIVRNLNAMLTNSGNTYLMNQRYPQMAFNPMTYGMYFKQGSGKGIYGPGGDSGYDNGSFPSAQYQELKKQALAAGVPADKVDQYVWSWIERSQPRYRSSYNQMTGYPGNMTTSGYGGYAGGGYPMPPGYYPGMETQTGGYYEDGGYIPEYSVGGWH